MFIVMFRTIILYIIVVIAMRLMGKRQIGELQPFELAITIMISELASLPMQDVRIPLIHGIIPIITLLVLEIIISLLELKSEAARAIFCGRPSILIKSGIIDVKELKCQRFNVTDLLEELRLQGYYNLEEIRYAILETNGQLSVITKNETSAVTKKDMKIPCKENSLPIALILDGKINHKNLKTINKNEHWLYDMLKKNNVPSPQDLIVAMLDSQNNFYYQFREGGKNSK